MHAGVFVVLPVAPGAVAHDARRQPLPLEVTFSAPAEGEADVRLDTTVRIQFSRDVDVRSFEKRIRLSYSAEESAERGEAQPPATTFTIRYRAPSRALEIVPDSPAGALPSRHGRIAGWHRRHRRLGAAAVDAAVCDGRVLKVVKVEKFKVQSSKFEGHGDREHRRNFEL